MNTIKRLLICILVFNLIAFNVFSSNCIAVELPSLLEKPSVDSSNLTIYSDCILLMEKETGDILYEKNAYKKMYPASTTKMLTAIIVLENSYLNEIVTVSSSALSSVPSSYTIANLQVGEKLRVEDLLYAMLIPSANDAANVLAEHISGSISTFAELMNKKAKAIGLNSSNFTNPSRYS